MCRVFGFHVERLKRIRIMNIGLGDLKVGEYREADPEEWRQLKQLLADSSETPVSRTDTDRKPHQYSW
jgi:23S rRNA pseudouridine2604 synthase